MSPYNGDMVSTVQLNDDVMKKLEARAAEEGTTVPEVIAKFVNNDSDEGVTLTAEQQAIVEAADEAVERGEWFSKEQILAELKAVRR